MKPFQIDPATQHPDSEAGASMVEYALLIILIAIVAFVAVGYAGDEVSKAYSGIASSVGAA